MGIMQYNPQPLSRIPSMEKYSARKYLCIIYSKTKKQTIRTKRLSSAPGIGETWNSKGKNAPDTVIRQQSAITVRMLKRVLNPRYLATELKSRKK